MGTPDAKEESVLSAMMHYLAFGHCGVLEARPRVALSVARSVRALQAACCPHRTLSPPDPAGARGGVRMAIYHLSVKPLSRAHGRSATAAAAYRSCSQIRDERTAELHDYSRKRGLEHAEIVLPTAAAKRDIQWARNRTALWNAAEFAEKRRDSRVACEYEVAVPHELTKAARTELVRDFS